MEDNIMIKRSIAIIALIFALIVGFGFGYLLAHPFEDPVNVFNYPLDNFLISNDNTSGEIVKFESNDDFQKYLSAGNNLGYGYSGFGGVGTRNMAISEGRIGIDAPKDQSIGPGKINEGSLVPSRISSTNVQVYDIDEADILKTNGEELFYSSSRRQIKTMAEPSFDETMMKSIAPPMDYGGIKVVDAYPPADLSLISEIDTQGEMFLADNTLIVNGGNEIVAYNVFNPKKPSKEWNVSLNNRTSVVTSRLYDNELYLITRTSTYSGGCPINPLSVGDTKIEIACTDIYHPIAPISVDAVYTVMKIDTTNGDVLDTISFVGSSSSAAIYMSKDSIYLTYNQQVDYLKFTIGFMLANEGLFPARVVEQLIRVNNYDLSNQSKLSEMGVIMNKWMLTLSDDDRLQLANEMENKMSEYFKDHARELEQTNIVKISNDNLNIGSNGQVPGRLLNQFSLDEYDGNLRVATTIGERSFGDSMNDIYVLDGQMKIVGSVQNLGLNERIYSVRFLGDWGYVVTFKQTDPFYILDLSNPKTPKMTGELKIPGYSSYLHPIAKNRILGIGEEHGKVKVSLFDVSDKSNPREIDKYSLDEYWSEANSNHHAFLADKKFKVFFIPASKGGYIFSYSDDNLKLVKAIAGYNVKRSLFIDDYFYVVGDDGINVYNESDWQAVNSLDF